MSEIGKNPCIDCPKKDPSLFESFEYGCDSPCQEAKQFYKQVNCKLDDLLNRANILLHKAERILNE